MQPQDERRALLEAVAKEVIELERLCTELEAGVTAFDWSRIEVALRDCRRVTHALENALRSSDGQRDDAFEKQLQSRVQRILQARDTQLTQLQAYNEAVGEKLRAISKWKTYARAVGARRTAPPSAGLDRVQ